MTKRTSTGISQELTLPFRTQKYDPRGNNNDRLIILFVRKSALLGRSF